MDSLSKPEQDTDLEYYWGIDIGGTQIKIGLVDAIGNTHFRTSIETNELAGPDSAMDRIAEVMGQFEASTSDSPRADAIGIGAPGPMDLTSGMLVEPPQLPSWRHYAIVDEIKRRTGRQVSFQNDANAAAYGEFWLGSGQEHQSMLLLTLGTGVGGGIVIDGELANGANSFAGEVGHMIVNPAPDARLCIWGGGRGQLEAYGSASAVSMLAEEKLRQGITSCLNDHFSGSQGTVSAKDVYDAARRDDALALEIIDETAKWLGIGVTSLTHTVDPGAVVLGGAMNFGGNDCPIGQRFLHGITEEFRRHTFDSVFAGTSIKFASLGSDAGYLGAAGYARKEYNSRVRLNH